jgi:hypothetical protein
MATAPLTPQSTGGMEELLAQLEPNIMPAEPSAWPLALGYWLILLAIVTMVTLLIVFYLKKRPLLIVKQEIKRIASINSTMTQLEDTHQLLRWLLHHKLGLSVGMTDSQLHDVISRYCSTPPHWLNQHYTSDPKEVLVVSELNDIVTSIFKEAAK